MSQFSYEDYIAEKHAREQAGQPTVEVEMAHPEPTQHNPITELLKIAWIFIALPVTFPLGLLRDARDDLVHPGQRKGFGQYRKNTAI